MELLTQSVSEPDDRLTPVANSCALPVGGTDPTRFEWTEAWYPIHYIADLDPAKPLPFTLLERDIVIWWDKATKSWCAFDDQCPHRLAPLSQGRIAEDGLLECPYHGWAFKGTGECDRIPQQAPEGNAHTSKRACVASLPTAECQGLLFVYAGNPDHAPFTPIPQVAPLEETPDEWICLNTFRDLPYDALTLLENVLDASHVPYTHHRSVGNRANASPVELELLDAGKQGFQGTWAEGPRRGQLGRQDTMFIAPNLMWHDLTSKQFGRTMTVVYATPIRKGECRLFARFPFKFATKLPGFFIKLTPIWYSHLGQNAILEDDQIFLHLQERYLEMHGGSQAIAKAYYLPTKADMFVSALRNWVTDYQANPFPRDSLSPVLSQDALLDRYHSHTKHCRSCRQALTRIQGLQAGCLGVAAIAWTITPLLTLLLGKAAMPTVAALTLVTVLVGAAWLYLRQLEKQFYQGRAVPPRNLPDTK